jgi:hypothetical protein
MDCQRCGTEVVGDIMVEEESFPLGTIIRMKPTPDRNWIACDSCNILLCHHCCRYPESGYCDECIEGYQLRAYLIECGLIRKEGREEKLRDLD